jgi:hypothetical protein
MSNPNWYVSRTSQMYLLEEASYATAPTLLATSAFRHLPGSKLSFNPRTPAKSPERHTDPSQRVLYTRRQSGSFDLKAQMYPSGTLNTLPELDLVYKNGFGAAAQNITLATTVSSGPTTTGAVVASATGLAIGQMVELNIAAGGNAGTYIRRLTNIVSTTLTWSPALPGAQSVADTVKGMVTYSLGTTPPKSLDIAHYPQAPSSSTPARELLGSVIDKLSFMFDSNLEPQVQFSGPAQGLAGTSPNFTPQSQPGGFTTVGAENILPSGLTGYFYLAGNLYQIEKMQIDIVNGMDLQNTALGTNKAGAFYRKGKRFVTFKIDAKVSDDVTLWTPSLATSSNEIFIQIGTVSARMWAIALPNAIITDNPDIPDSGDETQQWSFVGEAMGSAGNDEIVLGAG